MVLQIILTYSLKLRPSQLFNTIRAGANKNTGDGVIDERSGEEHFQFLGL